MSKIPDILSKSVREDLIKKLEGKKSIDVLTLHNKYDDDGTFIGTEEFNLISQESFGTNKLFHMAGLYSTH